jgi:DNA invertase Pin-like site-specific DNA recombinase
MALKLGYARVSTEDQNPELQIAALKKAGCEHVYTDQGISGSSTGNRPALKRCLEKLRPGDTLIVWKLDRLGRTVRDLIHMLDGFSQDGIYFQSLTEHIETVTPTGRAMWQMIGVMAELERSLIAERTRAGIAIAKKNGTYSSAKRFKMHRIHIEMAKKMMNEGKTKESIADLFGVHPATLWRALRRDSDKQAMKKIQEKKVEARRAAKLLSEPDHRKRGKLRAVELIGTDC